MGTSLWFIAILPPPAVQEAVTSLKLEARERFGTGHALTSPPHITLIPPFRAGKKEVEELGSFLSELAVNLEPCPVVLDGFASFPPRVIYVDVQANKVLQQLQGHLENEMRRAFDFQLRSYDQFRAHMTIAFRDLAPEDFPAAWSYFQSRSFHAEFQARELSLLTHREGKWQTARNFLLGAGR